MHTLLFGVLGVIPIMITQASMCLCIHVPDATVAGYTLQAQERALKELNMLKNGRDTLDMSVLDGCTDDNLRTRIGEPSPALIVVFALHVGRFHCSLLDLTIWQHDGNFPAV